MRWAERRKARWGNTMADFTFKGFRTQVIQVGGLALFENPEDLGAVKSEEHRGIRPASMWQWESFQELLACEGVATVAFYQQDFGTMYLKPTRLLLGNFNSKHEAFVEGPPAFDDQGFYVGPLRQRDATVQLVGKAGIAGHSFATTGTEQWPSAMCKWIAWSILQQFSNKQVVDSVLASEGDDEKNSDKKGFTVLQPEGPKLQGGVGPPRQCQQRWSRPIVDGAMGR